MSNPFQMVADAIAFLFGLPSQTCDINVGCGVQGWVAGTLFAIILAIIITIALSKRSGISADTFLIMLVIGGFISSGFGWFPLWFPIAIIIVFLFFTVDPLSIRKSHGGA